MATIIIENNVPIAELYSSLFKTSIQLLYCWRSLYRLADRYGPCILGAEFSSASLPQCSNQIIYETTTTRKRAKGPDQMYQLLLQPVLASSFGQRRSKVRGLVPR